jgi:hypothetical protein
MSIRDEFYRAFAGSGEDLTDSPHVLEALLKLPLGRVLDMLAEEKIPPLMVLGGEMTGSGKCGGMVLLRCRNPRTLSVLVEAAKSLLHGEGAGLEADFVRLVPSERLDG